MPATTRSRTAKTLEEAARKPGKVVRNDGDFAAAVASAAQAASTAEYYLPHLAHASMEPPAASGAHRQRQVRGLGVLPVAAGRARSRRQAARHAGRERHRARDVARRRLRTQVQARFRHRGGGAVEGDGRQAGQGRLDARRRSAPRLFPHRLGRAPRSRASTRKACPSRGCTARVAPTIMSTFDDKQVQEANWELGMGVINVPFAIPNIRIENPDAVAHTRIGWFRSVSNIPHAFAVQSFVAELAAAAGRDPKDYLLEVIGPAASGDAANAERHLEPRRIAGALSRRHRTAAARRGTRGARRRAGGRHCRRATGSASPRTTVS